MGGRHSRRKPAPSVGRRPLADFDTHGCRYENISLKDPMQRRNSSPGLLDAIGIPANTWRDMQDTVFPWSLIWRNARALIGIQVADLLVSQELSIGQLRLLAFFRICERPLSLASWRAAIEPSLFALWMFFASVVEICSRVAPYSRCRDGPMNPHPGHSIWIWWAKSLPSLTVTCVNPSILQRSRKVNISSTLWSWKIGEILAMAVSIARTARAR